MDEGNPDGTGSEFQRGLRRVRKRVAPVLVALLCCLIIFAPVLSSGTAVVEERYPDDGPPEDCIDGPDPQHVDGAVDGGAARGTVERSGASSDDGDESAGDEGETAGDGDGSAGDESTVVGRVSKAGPNQSAYRVDFDVPASRDRPFAVESVPGARVVTAHGFEGTGPGSFAWDGTVEDPWVRVAVTGRTVEGRSFPLPSGADHLVGRVVRPGPGVRLRPADEGTIGARYLVLDDVDRYETTVGCQRITLVVPDAVSRDRLPDPERILGALSESARRLDVGHAYRNVRVFVMPGQPNGSVAGQARDNEAVVYAGTRLSAAWNVWIHEYVHTRQGNLTGEGFGWFREASASYLSVRLALEQGLASPRDHDGVLAKGSEADHRLLAEGTDSEAGRLRGAAVLSRLEAVLLEHDRSVGDVLAWANARDRLGESAPSQRRVERLVENWTGSRVTAERFRVNVGRDRSVEPDYATGPQWLPRGIRRLLPGFGHPIVRVTAGLLLVGSLLVYYRDLDRGTG